MPYRIPRDPEVLHALERVLDREKSVPSQRRLKRLVEAELSTAGQPYRVGRDRVRLLAIRSGMVKVYVHWREPAARDSAFRIPHSAIRKCPACGSRMGAVLNRKLTGGKVVKALVCRRCGLRTGGRGGVPTRYRFTRRA